MIRKGSFHLYYAMPAQSFGPFPVAVNSYILIYLMHTSGFFIIAH